MRTLTIGVVVGVSPDRWVRVWRERMPEVLLTVVPIDGADAGTALGTRADLLFARLPVDGADPDTLHSIELWEETPVVVAARDHPVKLFDTVELADLESEEHYDGWDEATLDLVAAGHGVVLMPQSVFRATGRRDLVARPIRDAEPSRIALVWLRTGGGPEVDEFIGVVRGRTSNSSRGAPPAAVPPKQSQPTSAKSSQQKSAKRPDPRKPRARRGGPKR